MRGMIILSVALSSIFLLGIASCSSTPDIWECGHVWNYDDGVPIEKSYLRCYNYDTEETRNIPIVNINRCIRDKNKRCRWVMTDITERNRISSCTKNPNQDMCK